MFCRCNVGMGIESANIRSIYIIIGVILVVAL